MGHPQVLDFYPGEPANKMPEPQGSGVFIHNCQSSRFSDVMVLYYFAKLLRNLA
jgi:hypothetical protein